MCVLLIGKLGASPRYIAHVMTEAVVEFAARSPVHLKHITVCIFQPQMVQEFADAVAKKASSSSWQQTFKGVVCFTLYYIVLICRPTVKMPAIQICFNILPLGDVYSHLVAMSMYRFLVCMDSESTVKK